MSYEDKVSVIWDFDGTLVSSSQRNLDVTKNIFVHLGKDPSRYRELSDSDIYTQGVLSSSSWKDFYFSLGLNPEEVDSLARLWSQYQGTSKIPLEIMPEIRTIIKELSARNIPQAVLSINSSQNIRQVLDQHGLLASIGVIIGYDEAGADRLKPNPHGVVQCIEAMAQHEGRIIYIGDHVSDVETCRNSNKYFSDSGVPLRTVCIVAKYIIDSKTVAMSDGLLDVTEARTADELRDKIRWLIENKENAYPRSGGIHNAS
jgi:phosphoglycolate phosphatase-like HAD superfamily hydrolase